jgi:heme/copper-type cytochrome/quinol oxidase subunit 3
MLWIVLASKTVLFLLLLAIYILRCGFTSKVNKKKFTALHRPSMYAIIDHAMSPLNFTTQVSR